MKAQNFSAFFTAARVILLHIVKYHLYYLSFFRRMPLQKFRAEHPAVIVCFLTARSKKNWTTHEGNGTKTCVKGIEFVGACLFWLALENITKKSTFAWVVIVIWVVVFCVWTTTGTTGDNFFLVVVANDRRHKYSGHQIAGPISGILSVAMPEWLLTNTLLLITI